MNDYDSMDVTVNSLTIKPTVDEPITEPDDSCIHIPGEVIRRINPTCTENGWEESVCSICSETFISRAPVIKKWIDDSLYPETEHPYDWEAEDVYTINYPDADFIEITFSNDFYFWEDRNDSGDADWLYVYDHCAAIDTVLHKGRVGEVYNIGGHNEKTNMEITRLILDAMGKDESSIKFVEDRLGHDRRYAISNDKITAELGWKPSLTFEEGIKITIDWYLNNQDWIKSIEDKKASLV